MSTAKRKQDFATMPVKSRHRPARPLLAQPKLLLSGRPLAGLSGRSGSFGWLRDRSELPTSAFSSPRCPPCSLWPGFSLPLRADANQVPGRPQEQPPLGNGGRSVDRLGELVAGELAV